MRSTHIPTATIAKIAIEYGSSEKANGELTRALNRDLVLEHIRSHQPLSRIDLSRSTGLQPNTISSIADQLMSEGWIREVGRPKTPRGRPPSLLSLNDDVAILAVDIRQDRAIVAAVDLTGRFLARHELLCSADPTHGIAEIAECMFGIAKRLRHAVKGIGVSVPGRVDPATNRISWAPNLPWRMFDIAGELEAALDLPVAMGNAANAALLSRLWFGQREPFQNAVLVTVAEDLGVALYTRGQLVLGQKGVAGEFAHVPIYPDGELCRCGQRGCWEMYASSLAVLRYYHETGSAPVSMAQFIGLVVERDKAALDAVRRQARAIAHGLRMVIAGLAPEIVMFAGDIHLYWEVVGPMIRNELAGGALHEFAPRLVSIGDGDRARLMGAAALVLQRNSTCYRALNTQRRPAGTTCTLPHETVSHAAQMQLQR